MEEPGSAHSAADRGSSLYRKVDFVGLFILVVVLFFKEAACLLRAAHRSLVHQGHSPQKPLEQLFLQCWRTQPG